MSRDPCNRRGPALCPSSLRFHRARSPFGQLSTTRTKKLHHDAAATCRD